MRDRRLERRLKRINSDGRPPRALAALIALGALAALLPQRHSPVELLALLLLALVAGAVWLRQYHRARPVPARVVDDLALGAFLGAWVAGVLLDLPDAPHEWLRAPATDGGPAALFVLVVAMAEDLARTGLRRVLGPS